MSAVVHPVPHRLQQLEPLAALALAGHAAAVQAVIETRWHPTIGTAVVVLAAMGVAGLAGARSTAATTTRGAAILLLGFALQAVRADSSGYFLLWFFVLVSVYPLVLPGRVGGLVPLLTPTAYLALVPLHAVDGSVGIALLRVCSLTLLGVFAHQAARSYRDVAGHLAQSEATARQALTTLQRSLLPVAVHSQPDVLVAAGYRAAGAGAGADSDRHPGADDQIGGDWYDTVELPDGGLALVIGDVEGHDLVAASTMGLVRGAVRSYALEGHPPSVVLQRVDAFLESTAIERLVTVAYVQLHPGETLVTVALAGHPAPVVVPAGVTGAVPAYTLPCPPGPPLGLHGVAGVTGWPERTVQLPPGATLVLHTDGLADLPGSAALSQAAVDDVAAALIATASGHDDAAVLVARVVDAATPAVRSAMRALPARPVSAGVARTWLGDLFAVWQAAGAIPDDEQAADLLQVAQLLLTELFSNAVRHSERSVCTVVAVADGCLRVEVADTSERMPVLRSPEEAESEGRGLRLVDALATEWGVRLDEHGKSVWFTLALGAGETASGSAREVRPV